MMKLTNHHLVLSGDLLEVYEYEFPMAYDFPSPKEGKSIDVVRVLNEDKELNRERSKARAQKRIRRLVHANFGAWTDHLGRPYLSKFLTLTFRDRVFDVQAANKRFTLFIKRLNYTVFHTKSSVIKYIAVIEFQPNSKKVHYHVILFNLPYIPRYYDMFSEAWGNGFIHLETVNSGRRAAHYITKYLTKEDDERLRGEKSFFCSRGLKKPIVINDDVSIQDIQKRIWTRPNHQARYSTEYMGQTVYRSFDLSKHPELKAFILNQSASNR